MPNSKSILSLTLSALFLAASGCAGSAASGKLAPEPQRAPPPAPIAERSVANAMGTESLGQIAELNTKAGAPSFALIGAYYNLPVALPAGAATVERGVSWGQPYERVKLRTTGKKDWALEPTNVEEAQMLETTLRGLLDAGVQMRVIEMADANKVMEAEQNAAKGKGAFFPNLALPSGSDILVSVQRGEGMGGKIIIGRAVRTKDGALLALASQIDAGPISLRPLILKLVEDSLKHAVMPASQAPTEEPPESTAPDATTP